jgi:hypothetical protein
MADAPVSAADIAEYRQLYVDLGMPDTFALERDTTTPDDAGGSTVTSSTVATGVCRLRSVGGGVEQETAARLGITEPKVVTLPVDVAVQGGDRLVVNGATYEVRGIDDAAGAWDIKQDVFVERVR